MKYKFKYSYIIYANLIFLPFLFCLFYTCCSISHRITQQCIQNAFIGFFGFFILFTGSFNLTVFCCLFMWGFDLSGPLSTINIGIFACTRCIHLIRCFLCTWSMFLNKCFYLGFFYGKSFCFFVFHIFLYLYSFGLF